MESYDYYESPIGKIYVVIDELGLCKIELFEENWENYLKEHVDLKQNKGICRAFISQLDDYFKGVRKTFDYPINISGTPFQKSVWQALMNIPYGETRSYQEIAESINNPKAVRAVGQANRVNRLPIVIPCHRVIGKDGKLVGYAGEKIDAKDYLLNLEKSVK